MAMAEAAAPLTADDHAKVMAEYSRAGEERARALGNRGPIRLDANGRLAQDILDAYWTHGFYVFEGVAGPEELAELRADVDAILERAPVEPGATIDR
ncbi:MAG: phytanoyl-CoA dioxygenase, partial [Reyranella sp.]